MFAWAIVGLLVFILLVSIVLFSWNQRITNERKDFIQKLELEKLERDLLKIKVRNQ